MASQQPFRPHVSPELQGYLDNIATMRGRPVVFIVGQLNDRVTNELSLYSWGELKKHNELSVLMHSLGGNPKEAYRMMLILRLYVKDIEVLVPQEAKSAATLFCLGADKVLVGSKGELGPLDMQLVTGYGRRRSVRSAIETFKASEQMLDHTMLAFRKITDDTSIDASQTNRQGARFRNNANTLMSSIVSNLYQRFDADELGVDSRSLSVGEQYALRLLRRANYDEDKIQDIAHRLVWEYPSHDFLIDWREAKEIGLNIEYLDENFSKYYEMVLSAICEYRDIDHHYELLNGDDPFGPFFALGIPEENDEQVGADDGSDDKGDDDATDGDSTTE